jgi:predicted ATP-dependent endonuclease of OLD family
MKLTPGVFISTLMRAPQENADRFSEIARMKQQGNIINTLKILEPRLQSLEVQSIKGVPFIFGDIGLSELLPLPMMGEGIARLMSIMLTLYTTKGGVVLIDEIENGLHYSIMTKVWAAIAQAARNADVQIFATTHSWECITAAHRAFSESGPYDFRLHRLDRIGDDIRAVTYSPKMLDTAIQAGLEVR